MKRTAYDLDTCMDIFDWFGTEDYDYLAHILLAKMDGEERLKRALPEIRKEAKRLVLLHRGCEDAYPENLLNRPA